MEPKHKKHEENGTKTLHNPNCSQPLIKRKSEQPKSKTWYIQMDKHNGGGRFIVRNHASENIVGPVECQVDGE